MSTIHFTILSDYTEHSNYRIAGNFRVVKVSFQWLISDFRSFTIRFELKQHMRAPTKVSSVCWLRPLSDKYSFYIRFGQNGNNEN